MIEKISVYEDREAAIINKINEIINVLNAIVIDTKDGTFIDGSKKTEPVDELAEQKRWIGKLCRFWDDNYKITKHFGILTRIDETAILKYEAENGFWYCACEPVKQDDDVIYKEE